MGRAADRAVRHTNQAATWLDLWLIESRPQGHTLWMRCASNASHPWITSVDMLKTQYIVLMQGASFQLAQPCLVRRLCRRRRESLSFIPIVKGRHHVHPSPWRRCAGNRCRTYGVPVYAQPTAA